MKAISSPVRHTIAGFDLQAPIKPAEGLGGVSFSHTIQDFKRALLKSSSENILLPPFNYTFDKSYFFLTISSQNGDVEIEIDLSSGEIKSMLCQKGYTGTLENKVGIGTSIHEALKMDQPFGYNLDTDWFDRTPFDGLIIYPPPDVADQCMQAALSGKAFPDFNIETVEIIELNFAKEHLEDELIFELE